MADFRDINNMIQAGSPIALTGLVVKSQFVSIPNGGIYTPDIREAMEHNINVTGATATIGNPILGGQILPGWAGILITHVRNASGRSVTVTWGSKWHGPPWTDPPNGSGVITLWHQDPSSDLWYASGSALTLN